MSHHTIVVHLLLWSEYTVWFTNTFIWLNVETFAPVVKWISLRSSEPSLGVRVPPGAQTIKDWVFAQSFIVCVTSGKWNFRDSNRRSDVGAVATTARRDPPYLTSMSAQHDIIVAGFIGGHGYGGEKFTGHISKSILGKTYHGSSFVTRFKSIFEILGERCVSSIIG